MKELGRIEVNGQQTPILLDLEIGAFKVVTPAGLAVLDFDRDGDTIEMLHTEVPPTYRNHGIGEALARVALDYARDEHLLVRPTCPFVSAFIESHPEYRGLVDPAFNRRRSRSTH